MIHVEASSVIDAPVDRVWRIVRDFSRPADWLPSVRHAVVDDGADPQQVGATRRLTMTDDAVLHERLLGLSDLGHRVDFEIFESPLPISNYTASIELRPISDGDRTYIRWFATFDAPPEHAGTMAARMPNDIYLPGFRGIAAKIEKDGGARD